MSLKSSIGDKDVLQRRPARNPRYDHVKPVVESGMTSEVAQFIREKEVKLRSLPGELFRRVATRSVAEYLMLTESPGLLDDGGYASPMDEYSRGGNGQATPAVEYLLLDCRGEDDYKRCHIKSALHYPRIKLHHSMNPFLNEMFAFKNKHSKVIVLYDLEEESAGELANVLFQKGVDNVGLLAGGLREFVQDYSSLAVGEIPVPIVPRDARMQRRADVATQARSEARSTVSRKPKSLSNSLARPQRFK